jgi:hypothetical protein
MRLPRLAVLWGLTLLAITLTMVAQDLPSQPKNGAKVCVATVANASTTSAFVERLTERLTKSSKQNKINAVSIDSRTTDKYPLQMSTDNGEEAKQKECDYVLLSQIRDPREHPLEPRLPEISIGGRVPSVDASDPMGGRQAPCTAKTCRSLLRYFESGDSNRFWTRWSWNGPREMFPTRFCRPWTTKPIAWATN